jgi:hypothetical protein
MNVRKSERGWGAASVLAVALAACGPKTPAGGEAPTRTAAAPAAALDPCAAPIRALCADPALAPLSGQMKAALVEAAGAVSAEGVRVLADNQQSWIEAQRVACRLSAEGAALNATQEACLRAALADRVNQTRGAVEKRGPFTFQRVELNQSAPVAPSAAVETLGPVAPTAVTRDIRFPRIDGDSPAIRKFNQAVQQRPRFRPEDQTEETTTYTIGYAGDDLVSIRFDMYDFTIGAANPNTTMRAVTINMRTGGALAAADVFKTATPLADFLTQRAVKDVSAQMKQEDETALTPSPRDVRAAAMSPANWLITDKALVLLFPPLSLGSGVAGPHEVAVSWRELKPYLNPDGPGPIKAA